MKTVVGFLSAGAEPADDKEEEEAAKGEAVRAVVKLV